MLPHLAPHLVVGSILETTCAPRKIQITLGKLPLHLPFSGPHQFDVLFPAPGVGHQVNVVLVRLGDDEVVADGALLGGEQGKSSEMGFWRVVVGSFIIFLSSIVVYIGPPKSVRRR